MDLTKYISWNPEVPQRLKKPNILNGTFSHDQANCQVKLLELSGFIMVALGISW